MQKKKKWTQPKLIVLMRGKPDEMVLSACKVAGNYSGPTNTDGACSSINGCYSGGCEEHTDS